MARIQGFSCEVAMPFGVKVVVGNTRQQSVPLI